MVATVLEEVLHCCCARPESSRMSAACSVSMGFDPKVLTQFKVLLKHKGRNRASHRAGHNTYTDQHSHIHQQAYIFFLKFYPKYPQTFRYNLQPFHCFVMYHSFSYLFQHVSMQMLLGDKDGGEKIKRVDAWYL